MRLLSFNVVTDAQVVRVELVGVVKNTTIPVEIFELTPEQALALSSQLRQMAILAI